MDRLSVGQTIRKVRESRGYSGKELATLTGLSAAAISKFERGLLRPNETFVERVIQALGLGGNEAYALRELTALVNSQFNRWNLNSGQVTNTQVNHAQREKNCAHLRAFSNQIIPGLIQSPSYIRAVFQMLVTSAPAALEKLVQSRIKRQKVLQLKKRSFTFVISEGALRTVFGSLAVQREQIEHLVDVIKTTPSAEIRVLPFSTVLNRLVLNKFIIYDHRTVNIETLKGELDLWTAEDVAYYDDLMNYLIESSLSPEPSREFLEDLLAEIGK